MVVWWCFFVLRFCGGVFVFFCGGVFVVGWWCFCGGVGVVVFV